MSAEEIALRQEVDAFLAKPIHFLASKIGTADAGDNQGDAD